MLLVGIGDCHWQRRLPYHKQIHSPLLRHITERGDQYWGFQHHQYWDQIGLYRRDKDISWHGNCLLSYEAWEHWMQHSDILLITLGSESIQDCHNYFHRCGSRSLHYNQQGHALSLEKKVHNHLAEPHVLGLPQHCCPHTKDCF